jgi:CHAT domain-containing protein/Tfp pilus assembly protein PilF
MKRIFKIMLIIGFVLTLSTSGETQAKSPLDEAVALLERAEGLSNAGKYEEAIPCAKKALYIAEKIYGEDHSEVAAVLNYLASLYSETGRYAEAEPLYRRSLEIREKALEKDHPDVATSLGFLAILYQETKRFEEAIPYAKRELEIKEKTLGKDHPDVVTSLSCLAGLYYETGRYAEAESLLKRSLEIEEKTLGGDNPRFARALNNLALLYKITGRYTEAEPVYKRSLEIFEKSFGRDHPDAATSLNNLAVLYDETGRYADAEPLHKRALEIREKALGKDHPDVAQTLNNLAGLYQTTGRYAEAEPLYKRSLEIFEKSFGRDHPNVATGLNNLAVLYDETGRYADAEPLYKRSLEISEKGGGKDHPAVATSLNNLAELYRTTGRYTEAEPLYKRSLEIREKALGREHPNVATSLNNLALLYSATGRYSEAEPLYIRSLEICEKVLGRDHPNVATSLNNLANLYYVTARYPEAEPLYKRSLEIFEKSLDRDHPSVALSLNSLAFCYSTAGKHLESHKMFNRSYTIDEKKRENVFLLFSEKEKLNYMGQTKVNIDDFIIHTAQYMDKVPDAVKNAFDAWLRWKGAVMEAQGRYIDAITSSDDPEIHKKFGELNNIRRDIAKLHLSKPEKMSLEGYRIRFEELEKKKKSLEAELSRLSKDFALVKVVGRADTKRISEILLKKADNSVYIDFANIDIYDIKEKKWAKPRYLVFVLLPDTEPTVKLIDLSETEETDHHIKAYLEEIKRSKKYGELPRERILKAEAKVLYELLLKPIEAEIRGKKHLYISLDGNLSLIPFEILMSPDEKYLMEDYTITYIAAGRDIVRFMDETVAKGGPLIIADPDYDMGLQEKVEVAKAMGIIETRGAAPLSRDAKDMRFKRLPDTKQEADAIERILKEKYKANLRNYQDKYALEEVLFKTKEPRLLHLATHGYFLRDEEPKKPPQMMGFISQERERFVDLGIENPMLRSGIVLAGVNASLKEGRDDGVVSAEKILGLRLKGTDLVVLSACETGVGDVKSGEGVFGLKRSFILSGAKTVVMSLWSIPSKETTELMTEFYTLMAKGKSKAEALREARLNLMRKKPNPFYWGAFIMVGNPN